MAFENQIDSIAGSVAISENGVFLFPRNRSESISAISEIIRGGRSDSIVDGFRGRSDSLIESSALFLPLLIDSVASPEKPTPTSAINATSIAVKLEKTESTAALPAVTRQQHLDRGVTPVTSKPVNEVVVRELIKYSLQTPVVEVFSTEGRVGAYSREERQVRIDRFRDKKKKRVWRKQIKYDCRKRLADTRPRIKGRFVSRKEDGPSGSGPNAHSGGDNEDGDLRDYIDVLTTSHAQK